MSVNKHLPHVFVLPEDYAIAQIATGFVLYLGPAASRNIQILPEAGGWTKVLDNFSADQIAGMRRFPERLIVLLIDFDRDPNRLDRIRELIPVEVADRVFILGPFEEAKRLKSTLGSFESIGEKLARDCERKRRSHLGARATSS